MIVIVDSGCALVNYHLSSQPHCLLTSFHSNFVLTVCTNQSGTLGIFGLRCFTRQKLERVDLQRYHSFLDSETKIPTKSLETRNADLEPRLFLFFACQGKKRERAWVRGCAIARMVGAEHAGYFNDVHDDDVPRWRGFRTSATSFSFS